jgi:hypothetical protein
MQDCRRLKHGGRVMASPFVAISRFHALFDACLSGSTAGLASSATTWCMRRRLVSLETAKSHFARAGLSSTRRPHACHHSIGTIPLCLPCTAVPKSCRASLFSPSSLVFHALYTTDTFCTVLLSLVVVSSTPC